MMFCECVATLATLSDWSPSVLNEEVSGPAAGRGAWRKVPRRWWIKSFPNSQLVALVARPRVNLTRFHGVLTSTANTRTGHPAERHNGGKRSNTDEGQKQTSAERRASMSWGSG